MKEINYNGVVLGYNEKSQVLTVDGAPDKSGHYSPGFIKDESGKDVEFIGFHDNVNNKFINLQGKILSTISIDDVGL